MRGEFPDREIRVGCLRGTPGIEEATCGFDEHDVVVPVLMARGYIHDAIRSRLPPALQTHMTRPLGEHPRLPQIVRDRALTLAGSQTQSNLLLIGHGTTRHQGADRIVLEHAGIARTWSFAQVAMAFLDAPPFLADVTARLTRRPTVAIGYFIDPGPHGIDDVIAGLANLGADMRYSGPIGMSRQMVPLLAELVESLAEPVAGGISAAS
ncbi:MAG: hypothetical protein R3D03_19660 [Geminicoccaceae bacterium]